MHGSALMILVISVARWSHCAEPPIDGDLSYSLVGLEELLKMERFLIMNLEEYAYELERKLYVVRSAAKQMRKENSRAMDDAEGYLANPINSFSIIRRMREDWKKWEVYIRKPLGKDQAKTLRQYRPNLPSAEDLKEAISGILRMQTTYDLKASDMAKGFLNNKQYEPTFSVLDCAAIGFNLFARENYEYATHWLQVALEMHEKSELNEALQLERNSLLEMYLDSLLKQMRAIDALRVIEDALKKQRNNTLLLMKKADIEAFVKAKKHPPLMHPPRVSNSYELGCRGEFAKKKSKLLCSYKNSTSAFLKLAPLKMEVIHLNPYIVLYYDVIFDKEIEVVRKLARPILEPAQHVEINTNEVFRTAKSAWLSDFNSDTIFRITERIGDMTGLDMASTERLQVTNYGLGGHVLPHYDFLSHLNHSSVHTEGDRICSVQLYLTDVEQGGSTVFPLIDTSIYARKGTAIMWYNLDNRGERDLSTIHGGCPVIVGSKWVIVAFIRSRYQEFRKPCYEE